ncbi:MAG TPA: ferritin-like domain-containing protein [Stellaceae bacterium]|nr:ferritin-like domain-containing protein [Stellaceae bacterium]
MSAWTLGDIRWDRFDRGKLDPQIVSIVKAASLVEYNGGAYANYLCRVFHDDSAFQALARRWGNDEIRHGQALGRWAELADPTFNFAAAFENFRKGYRIDFDRDISRRGSRAGEMIARCIVETGTSLYYTALHEGAEEPVLKEICRRIAADELRHYAFFYRGLGRCLKRERIGFWRRLYVAVGRIVESEDDELAYAYYAANEDVRRYDRKHCSRAYERRAISLIRQHHVARGVAMIFKSVGLTPNGRLSGTTSRLAWAVLRRRGARLVKTAA